MSNKWHEYEAGKAELAKLGLTPEAYAEALRELAKRLGL
jgi:hypothetical protein